MRCLLFALLATAASAELLRVLVVARHGNRAPNPQVPYVCPKYTPIGKHFQTAIFTGHRAALSPVGKAENWESGNFLKMEYKKRLYGSENKPWEDNGEFFAFTERMNRNVVSMEALLDGLWPEGTGDPGFLESRPNLVPFRTSEAYHDTLINLPRDGPCKDTFAGDLKAWNRENAAKIIAENKEVLDKFGEECGFNFATSDKTLGKDFSWGIKAATDAFGMAINEGIDISAHGQFDKDVVSKASEVAHTVTNTARFGQRHQITYWLGDFVEKALFANLQNPDGAKKETWEVIGYASNSKNPWAGTPEDFWHRLKMLVFLNHRELMMSLSILFGYDELLKTPLKAGSMIIYELHKEDGEEFIITKAWNPSQPAFEEKARILKGTCGFMDRIRGKCAVIDLYDTGTVETLKPAACDHKERCTLGQLRASYAKLIEETGTWEQVCHVSKKDDSLDQPNPVFELDDDTADEAPSHIRFSFHEAQSQGAATPLLLVAFASGVAVTFLGLKMRFTRKLGLLEDYSPLQG